jgi:hypothetical protein
VGIFSAGVASALRSYFRSGYLAISSPRKEGIICSSIHVTVVQHCAKLSSLSFNYAMIRTAALLEQRVEVFQALW